LDSTSGEIKLVILFHMLSYSANNNRRAYYVLHHIKTLVDNKPLIKKLKSHESEILHIKPANPTRPQYIGSDLHFSCGFEVKSFDWGDNHVSVHLKNDYKKKGSIFVYLSESKGLDKAAVTVNSKHVYFEVVARPSIGKNCDGRVLRVKTEIEGTGVESDGLVSIRW